MADDARRLRSRAAARDAALTRAAPAPTGGAPVLVARTKIKASYPSVAAAYYACESQTILGTLSEGGPATVATDGDTFLALNLGSAVPPQGTFVICTFVGNRWVFRFD